MARSNKYASLNFNDIYGKKVTNSTANPSNKSLSSSSSFPASSSNFGSASKTVISNSRIHGNMLVLTRPSAPKPKPIIVPQKQDPSPKAPENQDTDSISLKSGRVSDLTGVEPDSISLRPQGRTGSVSPVVLSPGNPTSPLKSPFGRSDRFVPPHLRPGFVGREEKPGPEQGGRGRGQNRYGGEEGRPKSGGGYDRMRRIGGREGEYANGLNRPGSSG